MNRQYKRVNMTEVRACVNVMTPGVWHDSDYITQAVGMDWRRVIFALLKAEDKGLITVTRPGAYREKKECNLYWKAKK